MNRVEQPIRPAEAQLTRRALVVRAAASLGAIRSFASLAALGASGTMPWAFPGPRAARETRLGSVLGPGLEGEGEHEVNVLSIVDLDSPGAAPGRIELDFYGHGIALDPSSPGRIALFEKAGKGACEIDLEARNVVRSIPTHAERDFYGHGAYSPDGRLLYATESVVSDGYRGVIVVRDARSLVELGEFPSFGAAPHDCVLRDGGATMVVTNGGGRGVGGQPCVTYVDVRTRRLIERIDIAHPEIGAGHLALSARGDLAVVSASRGGKVRDGIGAVSLRPREAGFITLDDPPEVTARMRGETLSVAIHEPSGVVGVTNPFGHLVTFWDLATTRFVRALELAYPRGIATSLDGSRFVISYGRSTSLLEVDADSLEPIPGSRRSGLEMHGSHIVMHGPA